MSRKNIAVILSGGRGSRFSSVDNIPKQYTELAGKSIIEHTIEVFQKNENIDEIAIVADPLYHNKIYEYIDINSFSKVKKVLVSGSERYLSSLSAINAYKTENLDCNLIFHDSVRPLVSDNIINNCINALQNYNAVGVAISATDTIIEKNQDKTIKMIPNRANFLYAQTPQGFYLPIINKAYELALQDPKLQVTDDCGVVTKYLPNEAIYIVEGSQDNVKITYKEDLSFVTLLLQNRSI